MPEAELDAVLGNGYGIFSGREITWAKLRFSPVAARWVAAEAWYPKQRSSYDGEGRYVLEVPYSDDACAGEPFTNRCVIVMTRVPQNIYDRSRQVLIGLQAHAIGASGQGD